MARLSKTQHFAVYEDGLTTNTSSQQDYYEPPQKRRCVTVGSEELKQGAKNVTPVEDPNLDQLEVPGQTGDDAYLDEDSRTSILTTTSISTLPEYYTEEHDVFHIPNALAAPILRPRFRRPESVRRMQMSSPSPSEPCSPRSSTSSHPHSSRLGELQLVPTARANESHRARRTRLDKQQRIYQEQEQSLPLILLHVTLLPVNLPWSPECMQVLLPAATLENLLLLRSKISETILRRGVLIPHPREEYEMLEERLLEAMELQDERVTKCGHFQKRLSEDSISTTTGSDQDSDSGVGSSVDGSDGELCALCQHHIKTSTTAVGRGSKKWTVKVYAANGLMRASAWAAAWSEMERVDVEIVPWISEDLRAKLDERQEREDEERWGTQEDEEARIREIVEAQVRKAYEERKKLDALEKALQRQDDAKQPTPIEPMAETPQSMAALPGNEVKVVSIADPIELPQIYRPSQIPLSVLLKNYLYLLAQDRRNVVVLAVMIIAVLFSMRSPVVNQQAIIQAAKDCSGYHQAPPSEVHVPNALKVDTEDAHEQAPTWLAEDPEIDELGLSSATPANEQTHNSVDDEDSRLFDMADE